MKNKKPKVRPSENDESTEVSKPNVYVGVSGGVDSSVALALLKKQGYNVTGVFLKVWNPDFLPCNWKEERRSAMRVCSKLEVPFKTLDCEKEYKEKIVDYMLYEYKNGRTPNPDVFCNKYIKFGIFLQKAIEEGAEFVATGHYAQKVKVGEKYKLVESLDKEKDQSYFLSNINQEQLSKIILPIGHLKKDEVRNIAKKLDLPTATKKDSQGLCFIGKVDMKDFLRHYIKQEKGNVLDEKGNTIGSHIGSIFYTIGERHGFEIFKNDSNKERFFVISKDITKNTITVGERSQNTNIQNNKFEIKNTNWIDKEPEGSITYQVCFRYHQEKQLCKVKRNENDWIILTENKQFGVSSGQIAVLYDKEICLGGGTLI